MFLKLAEADGGACVCGRDSQTGESCGAQKGYLRVSARKEAGVSWGAEFSLEKDAALRLKFHLAPQVSVAVIVSWDVYCPSQHTLAMLAANRHANPLAPNPPYPFPSSPMNWEIFRSCPQQRAYRPLPFLPGAFWWGSRARIPSGSKYHG